ncbi:TlpA disulfide reductase family protein [Salimicrobium halophilum]|uniref:Thiol-disulfide isomerase or thioredoxin n=1 Tax=Salimicrobium halophilum TaxID=86666 RepID=A0A1G8V843_9BACI|nr:TlpA disulfide reductase family protein [Salimicrobium halophilum]SDJ62296.1 Thiol-disulfide isomerase or thioredoxin [Salimicrobium halophilum]
MKAPVFSLPYLTEDKSYTLPEQPSKVVILTFWVSWCPDCAVDMPKKEQLFSSLNTDEVDMLTINVAGREGDRSEAVKYKEKFLSQPTLEDDGTAVYDKFGCTGAPTTVIISPEGEILHQFGDDASFMAIMKAIGEVV